MSRLLVDADAIRALADILNETGLTEIEIAEKDSRIRVVRAPTVMQAMAQPAMPLAGPGAETGSVVVASGADSMAAADLGKHPGAIKSPMVGIAYLSPEPSAPAFVTEGQQVIAGQTIMLIEAMKTFNQIKAPRSGTLTRVLVASGTPVEFGEVLAIVD